MSKKSFSTSEIITKSWDIFKNNLEIIGWGILINVVLRTPDILDGFFREISKLQGGTYNSNISFSLLSVIFAVVSVFVSYGTIYILLKLVDGKKTELSDFWYVKPNIISGIAAGFIIAPAIILGALFFIIPGIYLAIRFGFYIYFVVDKNLGPVEALKASWEITKGRVIDLFLFGVFLIFFNILGVLAFGIGLLITAPISQIATTNVYRELEKDLDTDEIKEEDVVDTTNNSVSPVSENK